MAHRQISNDGDIAIIGMACRVAGADSPSKLWDVLAASKDVQSEMRRFNANGFYKRAGGPRKGLTNVRKAYFMDEDVERFDNAFFSISPNEASAMDPQQRLLLEVTYEAVENAGIPLEAFRGSQTAVYTGITWNDYAISLFRDLDLTPKYCSTGAATSISANRVSYCFDLHGPSMVIDTACSSTMVALHSAITALNAGDASMAVVNGANVMLNPDTFIHMSELGFLSPTGRCRSFDAAGDGYVRGEGVLALLLKPVEQAIKDGDPIRAIIKGTSINQDGKTDGITLPSSEAQRRNMEGLYARKHMDPADVQYFEAHGTGTAAGDPLELSAIDAIFGESHVKDKLVVGSVKSVVGHLEPCAALAGIVKTVESLERAQIPPQMHFHNPNPKIDFGRIEIPTRLLEWPVSRDGIRRASINSFGFGGTNGHAILEQGPDPIKDSDEDDSRPFLFMVSAATEDQVRALASSYADYVEGRKPNIRDLAHTLVSRRTIHKKTALIVAEDSEGLCEQLRAPKEFMSKGSRALKRVAFVFTGQGAQWPSMGKQLIEQSPLFRSVVKECDTILRKLENGPTWSALEELCKPKETSQVYQSSFSQPLCTVLQIALVELLRSFGISPVSVIGHSSGEIGAAYCSGNLSMQDAVTVAYYRGLYLGSGNVNAVKAKGAMCAVGLSEEQASRLIAKYTGKVAIAAVNSPSSCTLSGDEDAVLEICEACKEDGTFCRQLKVDMAYHSHHMLQSAPLYEDAMIAAGVSPVNPAESNDCAWFSSVYGRRINTNECGPAYWTKNMVSTVRFTAALEKLAVDKSLDAILEIGPHPALKAPTEDTLAALGIVDLPYFSSCVRGKPDYATLLLSAATMATSGVSLNFKQLNSIQQITGLTVTHKTGRVLTDLPKYPWNHDTSFTSETRTSLNFRQRSHPRHELLGARKANDNPLSLSWRNILLLKEIPWLAALKDDGVRHIPPTTFVLMALQALREVLSESQGEEGVLSRCIFKDVQFPEQISLDIFEREDTAIEAHFDLRPGTAYGTYHFEVFTVRSLDTKEWAKACSGTVSLARTITRTDEHMSDLTHHDTLLQDYVKSFGLPQFRGLDVAVMNATSMSGIIHAASKNDEGHYLDPAGLASLFHLGGLPLIFTDQPMQYSLQSIGYLELELEISSSGTFHYVSTASSPVNGQNSAGLSVLDEHNGCLLKADDVRFVAQCPAVRETQLQSLFFRPVWHPDITFTSWENVTTLPQMVELFSHKYPGADIAIAIGSPNIQSALLDLLVRASQSRASFRSAVVLGQDLGKRSERIQYVEEIDGSAKFDLIFADIESAKSLEMNLCSFGMICVAQPHDSPIDLDASRHIRRLSFETVEESWALYKREATSNGAISPPLRIYAVEHADLEPFEAYQYEHIRLDASGGLVDNTKDVLPPVGAHVIILDCGEKSLLASTPADKLLQWTRPFVENVHTLLWITQQAKRDPYNGIAGSFVRTLVTEKPGLRGTSLIVRDECANTIAAQVYDSMLHGVQGDGEIELIYEDGAVQALRYQPDDELSASVGLHPPVSLSSTVPDFQYEIESSGPEGMQMYARPKPPYTEDDTNHIWVNVAASYVDLEDLSRLTGNYDDVQLPLGTFFAGTVASSKSSHLRLNTRVLGWTMTGAHRSVLKVASSQLFELPDDLEFESALSSYANLAAAECLVKQAGRATSGDKLVVLAPKDIRKAIEHVCAQSSIGLSIHDENESDYDLRIEFDLLRGWLVNGRPRSIRKLVKARRNQFTIDDLAVAIPSMNYKAKDYRRAFEVLESQPVPCVLLFEDLKSVERPLISQRRSSKMFHSDGAYVIVGGLGGLGRWICEWLIRNGVKTIVTLSRSGLASREAEETAAMIQRLGAVLLPQKVDATDAKAVSDCLTGIRQHTKIRGCFNLAMILEDAPFATMSPSQWDRALRVKIDTTWNLHLATQSDDIDSFIMFSSITSITGNRMQANYATGNAFLNAMAEYRQSLGLIGTAVALSSISGIGVLAQDETLLSYFAQVGHAVVGPQELDKVMTAAVAEGRSAGRPIISLGMQMFECIDGVVQAAPNQNQLFWTEFPEFGFLLDHKRSGGGAQNDQSLVERLLSETPESSHANLQKEFIKCLASILGSEPASIDPLSPISVYGVDSLNAVACRYWLFKELSIDVPVFELLGCKSISALIDRILTRLYDAHKSTNGGTIPEPKSHSNLEIRPTSHSQQRLWFLHKFLQDKTVYNLLLVCHIEGTVRIDLFKKAWSLFMERHEVLRSKLVDTTDGLQQIPLPKATFPIEEVDAEPDEYERTIEDLTKQARSHIFDLEEGELVRGWLLKSEKGWRFFLASHHLAWDRSSSETIFDETSKIYQALEQGNVSDVLPDVQYQFIDFTLWQNACLESAEYVQPLISYWSSRLKDAPESVSLLPMAHVDKRPLVKRYSTDNILFLLPAGLVTKLKDFCAATAATPFMFIAATISGLVARMTGDEDIVIGITDGDRGHSAFDKLVGFTVNMLAIRSQPDQSRPFVDFLEQFRQSCFGAYEHRGMPFDHLLNALNIPRRTAHSPVFQINVNYQIAGSFPQKDYGSFSFNKYDHYNSRVQSDMSMDVVESASGELECTLEFDTDLYDSQSMQEFSRIYQTFVENVLADTGNTALGSVKLASKVDEEGMAQQLHRPLDLTLVEQCQITFPEILSIAVEQHPSRDAIVDGSSSVTYAMLDVLSDKVARCLLASGAQNGDAVAVFIEPSIDMLVSIYGIVKAGCCYVPLQDTPDERIMSIIEDTSMERAIVDGSDKARRMIYCGMETGSVFISSEVLGRDEVVEPLNLSRPIKPDDAFCCMFTSGTTGRPKGVYLRHNALRCWAEGYHKDIGTENGDRFLLVSAIVFDVSLVSIYGSILYGGTTVVTSQEARYSPRVMNEIAVKERINNLILTPTQYASMLAAPNKSVLRSWNSLKRLALAGEAIAPHVVKDHFALGLTEATVWNAYGPAEAHLTVALGKLTAEHANDSSIPLHAPHFPARLYVLDAALNPTAIGVPGELYIGGASVCTGYINRPSITEDVFVSDPFASESEVQAGFGRMYRTGDRFCLTRQGTLLYQGRIAGDRQVKIRGMRTELGEIEAAIWNILQDTPELEVSQVAVVFYKTEQLLAAYIVCNDEPSAENLIELQDTLRFSIQETLPVHMRPHTYVFKQSLPRTASGKTDYKTLSGWPAPAPAAAGIVEEIDEELLTPTQYKVLDMWKDVIQLEHRPSPAVDFFSAGGHSLILIRVQEKIQELFGVELSLTDMFSNPTVQGLERLVLAHPSYNTSSSGHSSTGNGSETDMTEVDDYAGESIDWEDETKVPEEMNWFVQDKPAYPARTIIVTGASTMIGAYFLYEILTQTDLSISCIAVEGVDEVAARDRVFSNMRSFIDMSDMSPDTFDRVTAYCGSLSHPTLGLSPTDVSRLDVAAQAIFHLGSDVSLLKNYASLRAGNLGALQFLINLARGYASKNTKTLHYLSTWGVPHLQVWNGTQISSPVRVAEQVMDHMTPPKSTSLGYLKIRWAAERMLAHAAARGVPVSIFRGVMTAPPIESLQPLASTDINRRIIEGALQTGIVPDFGSAQGGGMSWVTTTYLASALRILGTRAAAANLSSEPQVWHVAPPKTNDDAQSIGGHITYAALADLLADAGYNGRPVRRGTPEEYFTALRQTGDGNKIMHAEALQGLWDAGWVPFAVDESKTRTALGLENANGTKDEQGFKDWILKSVIGKEGF